LDYFSIHTRKHTFIVIVLKVLSGFQKQYTNLTVKKLLLTRLFVCHFAGLFSSSKAAKQPPESQEVQAKPAPVALNRRVDLFSGIALIVGTMIGKQL
jgi:hypothetical protein